MTKRILSLLICLSLLLSMFAMPVWATEETEEPAVPTAGEFGIVGEWIWGETVAELGAEEVVARCEANGVTDIYLLVKGTGGMLGYNKTQYTENITRENRDVLQETIDAAHAENIRVHTWLVALNDTDYKAKNPEAGNWHFVRERDNDFLAAYNEGYREYMKNIVTEIVTNYDVDGIHLDYIRYNHACNGWSEEDFANLEAMGADIENVKYLIRKTFYQNQLEETDIVDADYIFNAYRNGDKDALLIAQYRRDNVTDFGMMIRDTALAINPDLVISGAIMPEGIYDPAFSDIHYGQNYEDCAKLYDYVVPMAYADTYGYSSAKMAEMVEQAIEKGNKVVMGFQSYYPTKSAKLQSDIEAIRALLPNEGVLGICHFRHSQFSYAKLFSDVEAGKIKVQAINTYNDGGWRWVRFEATEGITFTGAKMLEGFAADVPVEIAEDGSWIKIGYADDAAEEALPTLAWGKLEITFEGAPVDPDARIAYARIWINSNESRAYNSYEEGLPTTVQFIDDDGSVIDAQFVKSEEDIVYPRNPLHPGYRFMGWEKAIDENGDIAFTATYREIAPVEVYGDMEIAGDWIWGSDVAALGADVIAERSAKNGITDIYLLVKGVGGTLGFNKTKYTENCSREDQDVLQEMIDCGHAAGIRVHAWLVTDQDETYKENNPDSGMWHYKRARDNENITPYDEGYNAYMADIATELATNYDIDGIHLDYIRYNHLCNGWSEVDFANLEAMGANIENVRYLINKTFYADLLPEGEEVDADYIFNALRNGDPDATLIAQYRRQNVVNLAKTIIDTAEAINPDLIMSAAFMPEGAVYEGSADKAFADLHYGQNYADGAELYDYIIPMAYSASYGYSPEDMAQIAKNVVGVGAKVVMGLQSNYPTTSVNLTKEIEAIRLASLETEGILGICHFRHTMFSYAKFTYDYFCGTMDLDIINTYASAGYKWVQVDAAEGVKFTGAAYGEGFVADAPIEIAEDGSYVKFGYSSDGSDFIIGALEEGNLKLTFEGKPADPKSPVAIARIYITNESRAYNVYNDITNYTVVIFKDAEGNVISEQKLLPGEEPEFPEAPELEDNEFIAWNGTVDEETGAIVYTPIYKAKPVYTVTFVDHDGTVVSEQTVVHGKAAQAPEKPIRPGFRFMGWDKDITEVMGDMTVTATYREIAPMEQYGEFEIVGEWIHGSDVATLGADTIVERCAKNGITDIYLLVKGTGGTLGYNKTQYTDVITRERDVLQEMIDAGHAVGIRVHAWLVTVEDSAYKAANPESGIWHYVRAQDNDRINPYDEGYQTYMANIATEIATGYEVDGIHLDYIRYNHLANGWSETDFANLEAMGANIENVKYLINKTFYADNLPEGEEVDGSYIFNAYRNGDPDALLIAQYRRQNVVELAKVIIDAAKAVNPDLIMSAALMPEGAVTEGNDDIAFADLHYGQNYEDAIELYDYVCPMAYTGSYADGSPEWFAGIAQYAADLGNKVVMGTQAYYPAMSTNLTEEVEAVRQLLPNENILGIVHFRHTQFSYAKFNYSYNTGDMTVDIINTYASAGYKWVQIDAAKGVKFTSAHCGEGFAANTPIEIAKDGSYVKFGFSSDGDQFALPTLGEGVLKLTFEGTPADLKAPVAIARIYITNESRAFNVYNDLTEYVTYNFTDVEGNVFNTQTLIAGEEPTIPEAPEVEDYNFVEWKKTVDEETGAVVYTPVYEAKPVYTVTFVDFDGAVIAEVSVVEGKGAEAPKNPVRPGFRFMGWDKDITEVMEDMTVTATYREIAPMEQYGEFEIVGEWIWGETVAELGADTIIERCAKNGITDIYLLVKGTGGKLGYNKTQYTENLTREDQDVLQEMIDVGHAAGIRIHAWLVSVEDATYKAANPESGIWHYVRAQDNNRINPYDEGYQTYMANIATELATNYDIDGIHLDYIRYNHLANGWSETDFANLEAMGANIENVKYLINKTFYADNLPEGEEVDGSYIFNAYRNGDPDALLIAQYRRQNVVELAKVIIDAAKAVNPDLIMSAALMPEGAVTEGNDDIAFADLHYGQNYEDAVELYDYVCPMAYTGSYADGSPEWFANIAKYAAEVGNKVVMGTQAYYPAMSTNLTEEIEAVRQLLPNENILGVVHFRHSQFSYAKFNYSYNTGDMTVDIINTYASAGYKWVQIDAAEGVKFTAAEYGEGFVADAPIEIAEDGSYVKFGYTDDGEDFVLPTLGEGSLKLTFEGAPADLGSPVAIARIYITNESRAFNVYNDLTDYTLPYEDVKETDWFYNDVLYTYLTGLMNGVKETVFAPNNGTTRAQVATVLYRMAGSPSVEGMTTPFTDIIEGSWYYDAVVWGYNEGVIKGTSDTTFTPNKDVTREQLAALLFRFSGEEAVEADLSAYPDAEEVSTYAEEAMAWAVANGLINGVKKGDTVTLNPKAGATRAQIAAILTRYSTR